MTFIQRTTLDSDLQQSHQGWLTGCLMLGNCPPAEVQQLLAAEREYARCMRSRAVRNWPDPPSIPRECLLAIRRFPARGYSVRCAAAAAAVSK